MRARALGDGVCRGDATSLTGTSHLKLADAEVAMPVPLHVQYKHLFVSMGEDGLVKSAGRQGPTS